jgi:hypothetical protein
MTPLAIMSQAMTSTTLHELRIGAARAATPQKISRSARGIDGLEVVLGFSNILPPHSVVEHLVGAGYPIP